MNKYILALSLISAFTSTAVNALVIDDFSGASGSIITITAGSTNSSITQAGVSAFGETRDISITKNGSNDASVNVLRDAGLYAHSAGANTSATSTISWYSETAIDLIENANNNAFSLNIFDTDQKKADIAFSITDSSARSASFTLFEVETGIQDIAFSSFLNIDFHQIKNISIQVIGGEQADLVLSSFSTSLNSNLPPAVEVNAVPAPAALLLFTSSLAFLGLRRRKI